MKLYGKCKLEDGDMLVLRNQSDAIVWRGKVYIDTYTDEETEYLLVSDYDDQLKCYRNGYERDSDYDVIELQDKNKKTLLIIDEVL